jgi:ribosomal protein S18 acetylase RimI-like enzyme
VIDSAVTVRRANVADAAALADLGARLFFETYEGETPPADMAAFLAEAHGIEQQTRELSDPQIATFVAQCEGTLVGYTQVRVKPAPAGTTTDAAVELWRLYVDRRWHGRGVADALLSHALDAARALDAKNVWLSVWERNARAIAYYCKRGFASAGSHEFRVAGSSYRDLVMVRSVLDASSDRPAG